MEGKLEKPIVLVAVLVMGLTTSVVNAKLVACWNFDELHGTTIYDSAGNNDGTINGDVVWASGRVGGALKSNGSGDYVDCGGGKNEGDPNTWADITDEITVAAWIKGPFRGHGRKRRHTIISKGDKTWKLVLWKTYKIIWECEGLTETNRFQAYVDTYNHGDYKWHHVAGVYDGSKLYIYFDGELSASTPASGSIKTNDQPVYIGGNAENPGREWKGLIDEVAIFDHALSEDEITQLYRIGTASPTADPTLQRLVSAVGKAKALIKEQQPEEAIVFLEKTIAEYKRWRETNSDDIVFDPRALSSDLHFLLAKAKETAGSPMGEVTDTYKRVIQSDTPSALSYRSALLWLSANGNTEQYKDIISSLIQNNSDYLGMVAARAETMVREGKSKAAIKFLEDNLTIYTNWRKEHPYDDVVAEDQLPGLYFQLAQAREATGASKKDIVDVYRKTFSPSRFSYLPERTAALIWLFENEPTGDYTNIIKSFVYDPDIKDTGRNIVIRVYKYFEPNKNWAAFEQFLDALLVEIRDPSDWVKFVESCLSDKANQWAQAYSKYHDTKRKLNFGWDWIAEKYAVGENFKRASQRYRDVIENYDIGRNKGVFEWRLCECLFYAGEYGEAASGLEDFITNYKASHGNLTKEAILRLGRTYVKLGELDKAIEAFFNLTMVYPEAKDMPEVQFFVGYCYMLQSKFNAAVEVFDCLINDHPNSPYSGRARMCITRIKSMTD